MPSPEPWIARVLLALSAGVGPIAAAAETPVAIVHLSGASIVPRWELQRAESDVVRAFERIDVDLADPLAFVLTHEIDHLLLPDAGHAEAGVMRPVLPPAGRVFALRFTTTEERAVQAALKGPTADRSPRLARRRAGRRQSTCASGAGAMTVSRKLA